MRRAGFSIAGVLPVGVAFTLSALGQALVEPARVPAEKQIFETSASAPRLRCEISPVRPALDFGFRFQTGYTIEVPFVQFAGQGHSLTTHVRVTPEGRAPVYLTKTEGLPEVPDTSISAATGGAFLAGEGTYGVEVLVEDDLHRFCRGAWQIQPRRTGSERRLKPTTPPAAVEEVSAGGGLPAVSQSGLRIGKLTILVHAAPLSPNLSQLQPDDVQRLTDSLSSLLREMPAQTVRLIAFNLDQRSVIFRTDTFEASQLGALKSALEHLQLGLVDYRAMRDRPEPMDLLLGLVQAELRDARPPDALIVLGPRTRMQDDVLADAFGKRAAASPTVFSLQYRNNRPLMPPGRGAYGGRSMGSVASRPDLADPIPVEAPSPSAFPDTIERLVGRLKGQTIPVRTPHDLADAIQRMDPRIIKTNLSGGESVRPTPLAPPSPAPPAPAARQETESTGDEDPVNVLVRLRDQVVQHGDRIPNYTCVEAIQRERYEPTAGRAAKSCDALMSRRKEGDPQARLKLDSTDWLHLDVAMAAKGEIYSWAGASRFDDIEIDELVPEGALGTGPFGSMLLSIFHSRGPRLTFEGETTVDGRRLFEYSFAVPRDQSHYRVKAHKEWVITGYAGSLLVDPKSAELVRLVVRTEELPPETGTCETHTVLEYGVVQLGAGDYLLPKAARQRFIGREGEEDENTVSFSACREYQAESKLAFGSDAAKGGSKPGDPAAGVDLPAGLPVTVELRTAVRPGQAAAGDRIEGRLAAPIRDESQKTLVPEGAAVQGRLMRVEVRYAAHAEFTVALRWETVQAGGAMLPFNLVPNRRTPDPRFGGGGALRRRGTEIELPLPGESQYGVIHVSGQRGALESGTRSEWFTAKP